jgi:hypothetical protein
MFPSDSGHLFRDLENGFQDPRKEREGLQDFRDIVLGAPSISRSAIRIRISLVQAAFHKTRLSRLAIPADAYLSEFMQVVCRSWHQQGQDPALLPHLCRAEVHVSAHGMTCRLAYPDIRLLMQAFH